MKQHPELNQLLADFIQNILIKKPEDIFQFTSDYFSSCKSRGR